jgi:uncharacterized protein with gpF-like domain
VASYDELNSINEYKPRSIPYEKYFGEMDLTDEQKEQRIEMARDMEDTLAFLFALILAYADYANQTQTDIALYIETIVFEFKNRYREVLRQNVELDDYINDYIDLFSMEVIDTTMNHKDEEYYTSSDRAIYISENESNTVWNHTDYAKAVKAGKTKKKWIDIRDKRERKTHLKVGGTVKPINEPFVVGDSLMLYPHDKNTYGADDKEVINCRCSIKYF